MNNQEKVLLGLAIGLGVLQFMLLGNPSVLLCLCLVFFLAWLAKGL